MCTMDTTEAACSPLKAEQMDTSEAACSPSKAEQMDTTAAACPTLEVPTPTRARRNPESELEEKVAMCTRCGIIPRSSRKGVAFGLCCNKCPNHGPWCEGKKADKCCGPKKCAKHSKELEAPPAAKTSNAAAAADQVELLPKPRQTGFNGTWHTSKDEFKERPKVISKGVMTWTNGTTTLLHFPDEASIEMTFQGVECKGKLQEDTILWDDGDLWVKDETSVVDEPAQTEETRVSARVQSTKRTQKGSGKGKHRLSIKGKGAGKGKRRLSSKGAPQQAAKRHRVSLRSQAVAQSPAERLAELQAKVKLAEEQRQEKKEAAAERAAIRQVQLENKVEMAEKKRQEKESKAQMAEEKRKEKQALADVKAALRKVNHEFKAKMVEQKDQEKKRLKEVAKDQMDFKNAVKSSSALSSTRSAKSKSAAAETDVTEDAGAERPDAAVPDKSDEGTSVECEKGSDVDQSNTN